MPDVNKKSWDPKGIDLVGNILNFQKVLLRIDEVILESVTGAPAVQLVPQLRRSLYRTFKYFGFPGIRS